jgi:zinc transporter ZupT
MPEQIILIAFIIAVIFSAVHLTAPKLYGFSERYEKAMISFSGGVAAAYVFFDLLPTIQKSGENLKSLLRNYLGQMSISEVAIFGVAFMGFLVFFISEHAAVHSRRRAAADAG